MQSEPLYPSDLAIQALGIAPEGIPYEGESVTCSHCGKPIVRGDLYSPVSLGQFFSDTRDLADASGVVCGACIVMRKKKALNGFSFTVITKDGIFPIAQDIHKAWLFLDPPEPPFVAVNSSSTMMHLVWRTPVTLSKDLIYYRYGNDLFTMRPSRLRTAMEYAKTIQARRLPNEPKALLTPYIFIDRELRNPAHGQISPKALAVMTQEEVSFFYSLTPGEVWALGTLLKTKPAIEPVKPEPKKIEMAD